MDTLSRFNIILFLMTVLGASGTYLLLPHSHGRTKPKLAHAIGYAFSALAVLAFALLMRTIDVELVTKVFFYVFAVSAVYCAILTVTCRDPINSALWFAAVVLATSGLFLLSGAQFLAAGTVIVYAGAIIVTFLFVIMLAQKEGRAIYDRMARAPFMATLASFLLLLALVYCLTAVRESKSHYWIVQDPGAIVLGNRVVSTRDRIEKKEPSTPKHSIVLSHALPPTSQLPEAMGRGADGLHVESLGATLYTEHLVTVELAGALLFSALIGALAIATPKAPIRPTPGAPSKNQPAESLVS